jgi:hypothetical protein
MIMSFTNIIDDKKTTKVIGVVLYHRKSFWNWCVVNGMSNG